MEHGVVEQARAEQARAEQAPVAAPSAGPSRAPVVELRAVSKRYRGGGGVEGVSLEVRPGEVFGFVGPNGAGKTTTIRLMLDLIRPDSGTVTLFGLDARRDGVQIRRRLGYLPGDLALYDRLTARELLTHFAYLRSGPPWEAIAALAARFDLELDRPIRSLSKGNRQKVGIVQAFMGQPELLILDEPTTGLDPLVQHQVLTTLGEAAEEGRAVFLSSHILSEVGRVAHRVGLIRAGRLVAVEDMEALRARSVHLVDATLGELPAPDVFADLSGLRSRVVSGHTVHLEVSGELDPVVAALARFHLVDLAVREPDLEELFLAFYGTDAEDPPDELGSAGGSGAAGNRAAAP